MAQCSDCIHNLTRQCMVLHTVIPRGKETVTHDCAYWRGNAQDIDVDAQLARWMDGHPQDAVALWALQDMTRAGQWPPAGQQAEAWRVLYTAPYIDIVTRSAIIQKIIPF